ncbi:MAG: Gfo/Idh/MocA family protein [Alphaproteobacteria bacterium]
MMSAADTIRFGLIGYGAWGRLHAQSITAAEGASLVAICCHNDESATAAKQDYPDATIYRDYHDLVRDPGVDVADVVTPNDLHANMGVAALEAGKDVLLEKPMANTIVDCDRLLAAAQENHRVLTVGHELRLSSQWGQVKTMIDAGDIGTPRYANLSLFRHPFRLGSGGWRHTPRRVGSWMLEESIHFFDLLLWYFASWGDPLSVRAFGNNTGGDAGMCDNFTAVLKFRDELYAVLTQSLLGFEHHLVMEVSGDKGAIRTLWSGERDRTTQPAFEFKVLPAGADRCETVPLDESGEVFELAEQIRQTVAAMRERRPLMPGAEARKSVVTCLEAERSRREGREIELRF